MRGKHTTQKAYTKTNKKNLQADKKSAVIAPYKFRLTKKQKKFCEEYIANGYNATQAAIKAGYSKDTACVIGAENLTKPNIAEYLSAHAKKEQEKFNYTKETHFDELSALGDIARKSGDIKAAIKAVELKGKLCGLYIEKQEVSIKEPRRFVVEIVKPK